MIRLHTSMVSNFWGGGEFGEKVNLVSRGLLISSFKLLLLPLLHLQHFDSLQNHFVDTCCVLISLLIIIIFGDVFVFPACIDSVELEDVCRWGPGSCTLPSTETHCQISNTPQRTEHNATKCNTLQHRSALPPPLPTHSLTCTHTHTHARTFFRFLSVSLCLSLPLTHTHAKTHTHTHTRI